MARDGKFRPGQSGNPNGRPAGSRSKTLTALDALGEREAEAIVKATIENAKKGDGVAARTILDRVWPSRKGARLEFELPDISTAATLPDAIGGVVRQVAEGIVSPEEGSIIVGLLETQRKAIETSDLAERLTALETRLNGGPK